MIAKKCIPVALSPLPFFLILCILSFLRYFFVFGAVIFLIVQLFFLFFFRDMPRTVGEGVISPADGRVLYVEHNTLAIFMSLMDMHVNLMPYEGRIVKMKHYEGGHAPAYGNVGNNERLEMEIESEIGKIKVVQIAGMIARRIVPYVREGDSPGKGDKIGIIRFGSRVELVLPRSCQIVVREGQKIKAGETIAHVV